MTRKPRERVSDPELLPISDAEAWGEASNEDIVTNYRGVTISVRFAPDDARMVRTAARSMRLTQSEFVRMASITAARDVHASKVLQVRGRGASDVINVEDDNVSLDHSVESHGHVEGWLDVAAD